MRNVARVMSAGAALAFAIAVQTPVRAQGQTPALSVLVFHCHVEAGPRFTACQAASPGDLDPRKVENLRLAVEGTPACLIANATPGTEVDRPIRFLDSPALLNGPPGGQVRHTVINPDWDRKPALTLLDRYYPKAALAARVDGRVVLDCEVLASGAASACTAVEETPEGQGFGEAAVRASSQFRFKPKLVDCMPVDGGHISTTLNFKTAR
jgi:TonB family protein